MPKNTVLIEKIIAIIESKSFFDENDNYPVFSYKEDNSPYLISEHYLENHINLTAIKKRRDAIFTIAPPFNYDDFKLQVKSIIKKWGNKKGQYEFQKSYTGAWPLYKLEDKFSYVTPIDISNERKGDVSHTRIEKSFCVVVCDIKKNKLIGHIAFSLDFFIDKKNRKASQLIKVPIVWVSPEYRGLGYAANLGFIAGKLLSNTFYQVGTLLPASWVLDSCLSADYESLGGKAVVERIYREIDTISESVVYKCRIGSIYLNADFYP